MAEHVVRDYRPGAFLLAGPTSTLLAEGERAVVTESDPEELSARVEKALADSGAQVAVGALPFAPGAPAHVVVPAEVRRTGSAHPCSAAPAAGAAPVSVTPVPSGAGYEAAVAAAVALLRGPGELRKVVLARTLRLGFAAPVDLAALLPGLVAANPQGHTFAAPLPGGRTLLGATPELLVSRTGTRVVSNPLAGSLPRGITPEQDRALADELLASGKDQAEHRVVVEAVEEVLRPFCRSLHVPAGPSLVATPTVWHLSTRITGELADPGISALRLAAALHPTPAVCGTPAAAAAAAIADLEPFERGFYSGAVGWTGADGDGEWVVSLRCAEVFDREMVLYAGAGVMPASVPAAELAETSAKFATLLRGLGIDLPGA
ncbi:isochorismate synthase [Actinokineospora spheciospongiae]|uniref:isochorismate synthase n=1 Tax=Actinokineospora spheciospongiae TaxID=909613 RepID=UPI000550C4CB|nr:isochorismate synthase [Actinokineospora spheciospongiae]